MPVVIVESKNESAINLSHSQYDTTRSEGTFRWQPLKGKRLRGSHGSLQKQIVKWQRDTVVTWRGDPRRQANPGGMEARTVRKSGWKANWSPSEDL